MSWGRFQYICRRANTNIVKDDEVKSHIEIIENSSECNIYGKALNRGSIPHTILASIKTTIAPKKAIKTYSEMTLFSLSSESIPFKRAVVYLSYISLVLVITSLIYQIKVLPVFIENFKNMGIEPPKTVILYKDYWVYYIVVLSIFAIFSLALGFSLKKLLKFEDICIESAAIKFLAFPSIKRAYANILTALFYPASSHPEHLFKQYNRVIYDHLKEIETAEMHLATEINTIITIEKEKLIDNCEKQIRLFSILLVLVVILATFHFMTSVYSPIFILGESV